MWGPRDPAKWFKIQTKLKYIRKKTEEDCHQYKVLLHSGINIVSPSYKKPLFFCNCQGLSHRKFCEALKTLKCFDHGYLQKGIPLDWSTADGKTKIAKTFCIKSEQVCIPYKNFLSNILQQNLNSFSYRQKQKSKTVSANKHYKQRK